jgi:hypothetical protein
MMPTTTTAAITAAAATTTRYELVELASIQKVIEVAHYEEEVLYYKHTPPPKIMVFPIVRLFTLVQYKNGYWLCTGQERW